MVVDNILQDIDQLQLNQKIVLVESIWDSIAKQSDTLPLPQWQKQELDKRHQEFKSGDVELFELKSVHQVLREKSGR